MRARTSITHPLQIGVARVPASGGEIGMTLFPGRSDQLSTFAPWQRDLDADLGVVRKWHPAIIVSLVEDFEFALLGVADFPVRLRAFAMTEHIEWVHLPIRDGGVPDADFETAWNEIGASARAALRSGGKVLLHCRAGLGRTGTIAARLLVELGVPANDAVATVRAARGNTIETKAQERHVHAQKAIVEPLLGDIEPRALPSGIEHRFLGSLLGGAIGDALGAAFEFVPSAEIESESGGPIVRDYREALPGSLMHPRAAGLPTDDTAMTIALLESLAQAAPPLSIVALHRGICDALARGTGPTSRMFWEGGPGGACIAMLRAAESGAGPFERLDRNAGGNGAAMRAHVCGLFPDRAFVAKFAATQARLSHPHPAAVASAQTIALIAHDGFYTGKLTTELPAEITEPVMVAAWKAAHRDLRKGERLPAHLRDVDMAGWHTVSAAHAIAVLYTGDIETAIGIAAGSGRDTDTIASMVGAMLGAVHGAAALPKRWIDGLRGHEALEPWAERMVLMAERSLELREPFVAV